jgi:hypothetical protein
MEGSAGENRIASPAESSIEIIHAVANHRRQIPAIQQFEQHGIAVTT